MGSEPRGHAAGKPETNNFGTLLKGSCVEEADSLPMTAERDRPTRWASWSPRVFAE